MRLARVALVAVLLSAGPAVAQETGDLVVRKWLVIAPVDVSARRPLRPDAVFAKHLLDRASAVPKAGEEIVGTLGKPAKWAAREAFEEGDKNAGFVDAKEVGWAYASVDSAEDRVVIAKLEGASFLAVNGAGFTGDIYRLGDAGVPVALRKGANDVYVAGPRGGFRLSLRKSPISVGRETVPDLVEGRDDPLHAAVQLFNASTSPIFTGGRDVVPLGVYWRSTDHGMPLDLRRRVAKPGEAYRRTFVSQIDGSVQSYALLPPAPSDLDKSKIGLVLSLHGAAVECMSQARAYAPKPDFWIVCPTNRGNFGFDWQDWGRLDAYEVLEDALRVTGVDPRRVYLTGHSMGGHGTWHLAANDPGNLAKIPTYVVHGEKDDNVPPSEARLMIDALVKAGGKPESHFEPTGEHWWDGDKAAGADCVDWPGIWELFRRTAPAESTPDDISVLTTDPSIDSTCGWVTVDQPLEYGRPSRVVARWDAAKRVAAVTTENVRRVGFNLPPFEGWRLSRPHAGIELRILLDGREQTFPHGGKFWFVRTADGWRSMQSSWSLSEQQEKCSETSGPLKRAFTNRFVLVYGTAGDETETRELLEKARFDSLTWAYRANGDATLVSDAQFLAGDFKDRNVIVYGNADTNKAWDAVFDADCPIQAKRGVITIGGAKHEGVVGAAFVRPRKGSDKALAAAFADTGAAATRLFYGFPVFMSGMGIPDYVVFGAGFLSELDGDVRAAGWFDHAWRLR
jgi:pimeloyl-ACP methyl ester carboxylesterase